MESINLDLCERTTGKLSAGNIMADSPGWLTDALLHLKAT